MAATGEHCPSNCFLAPVNPTDHPRSPTNHVVIAAAVAVALLLVLLAGVDRTSADAAPTAAAVPAARPPRRQRRRRRIRRRRRPGPDDGAVSGDDHDDDRRVAGDTASPRTPPRRHPRRQGHVDLAARAGRGRRPATRSSPAPRPPGSPTSTCAPGRAGRASTAIAFLDALLPVAHARRPPRLRLGLPVPRGLAGDVNRAHRGDQRTRTPTGHRIDGFVARHRDRRRGHEPHRRGGRRLLGGAAGRASAPTTR